MEIEGSQLNHRWPRYVEATKVLCKLDCRTWRKWNDTLTCERQCVEALHHVRPEKQSKCLLLFKEYL